MIAGQESLPFSQSADGEHFVRYLLEAGGRSEKGTRDRTPFRRRWNLQICSILNVCLGFRL